MPTAAPTPAPRPQAGLGPLRKGGQSPSLRSLTALWPQAVAQVSGGVAPGTSGPRLFWAPAEGPRGCRGRSSDPRAAWGRPAEVAAAPAAAAAAGLGEAGLGARGRAEHSRLLRDCGAAFEGRGRPGLRMGRLPLRPDGQEGGEVEVQHGHPSAGCGGALAALRAGDPALLVGRCVQPPHACLAEGVATVQAAGQAPGQVVGRVADDAVASPGPSGCPLL